MPSNVGEIFNLALAIHINSADAAFLYFSRRQSEITNLAYVGAHSRYSPSLSRAFAGFAAMYRWNLASCSPLRTM